MEYSNNGNFALCEKSDGSEATGLGFYERHRNNNLNDIRLFTGIKFVVNKDNNNTMDTLGSNIKMLLRDDGKLLVDDYSGVAFPSAPTADISCPLVMFVSAPFVLGNNLLPPEDAIPLVVSYNLLEKALLLALNHTTSG